MAVSVSVPTDGIDVFGKLRVRRGTVTFDSSYPTGGEAVTAGSFGLSEIEFLLVIGTRGSGYVVEFVPSTSKLKALWVDTTVDGAPLAEVANTTDLSAVVADVIAFGY
jgi:hypothetical protein